jgi:hypothetical protein
MKSMLDTLKLIRTSPTFRLVKYSRSNGFFEGVSQLLNVNGKIVEKYNTDETNNKADYKSLESDWKAVGQDLYFAIDKHVTGK